MIIGGIEFSPSLERKLGPEGCAALKKFVDQQKERRHEGQWDGVSFEAGWSAALDLVRRLKIARVPA